MGNRLWPAETAETVLKRGGAKRARRATPRGRRSQKAPARLTTPPPQRPPEGNRMWHRIKPAERLPKDGCFVQETYGSTNSSNLARLTGEKRSIANNLPYTLNHLSNAKCLSLSSQLCLTRHWWFGTPNSKALAWGLSKVDRGLVAVFSPPKVRHPHEIPESDTTDINQQALFKQIWFQH